jgi:hypothetical protein
MLRASSAHAEVPPADAAGARTLFDDARKLMSAGKWSEACPKLEEGIKLNPGLGMRFNLADCWEHVGRTASAWALFLDVAQAAKEKKEPKKEAEARRRAQKLEGEQRRLLVLVAATARVPGLEVRRGDQLVGEGQWGSSVPVDPGRYAIVASAPGKVPFRTEVTLDAPGTVEVTIPPLADTPKPPPVVVAPKTAVVPVSRFTVPVWIALGVGVGGIGVGSAFGALALDKNAASKSGCNAANVCNPTGFDARNAARTAGDVSTVAFVVGGVGLAAAATLFLLSPSTRVVEVTAQGHEAPTQLAVVSAPWIGANSYGWTVSGRW